jgi:hypothetical protein
MPINTDFQWTPDRVTAAELLAEGFLQKEVAEKISVDLRTIYNWKQEPAFAEEVDRLTLMRGLAVRAERARVAKRAIRKMIDEETGDLKTSKDPLDWLKYMQSETNGAIFSIPELTAFAENAALAAGRGQGEPAKDPPSETASNTEFDS